MTTLAELVAQAPDPTWGRTIPVTSGSGEWRFVFMVADPRQGSSIEWRPDLTDYVSEMYWSRGSAQPRSKAEAVTPTVMLVAEDDDLACWNPDTSPIFGVHVPLRTGLLMRATVFRVVDSAVAYWRDLFTSRVEVWGDQSAANGGVRMHRVQGFDTRSYLNKRPIPVQASEGWYERIAGTPNGILETVAWPFGTAIYGAQTSDAVTTLLLPDTAANASGTTAIDDTLDPVGLVWRTLPDGSFVAHPPPWDSFHAGLFAGATTIVGDEWVSPIEAFYPGGPIFSYNPAEGEIPFIHEVEGRSFGVDSNGGNVLNLWEITHPIDVTDLDAGYTVSAYDDPVSDGYHGTRPMTSANWLAENDTVQQDYIDANAYTDLTAAPMMIDADHEGVFPAIAILDQFDPVTIKHATRPGRSELTVSGPMRRIDHTLRFADEAFQWTAEVSVDVDAESVSSPLLPVESLAVSTITHQSAQFSWTNPTQTITPTETQFRITQISTVWLESSYPGVGAGGIGWAGLPPATFLTFEVRLVRRVDGLVTHVSPARSISFTTSAAPIPIIGGDDHDQVDIPDIYDPDCIVEWKVESSDDGGETWDLVDSGDENDPEVVDGVIDLSGLSFDPALLYRVSTREVCDEVPGDWADSEPFNPGCPTPAALGSPPYDADLIMYVPKVCGPDILEVVSGSVAAHGPAWAGLGPDGAGGAVMLSGASQGVVVYGSCNDHEPDAPVTIGWVGQLGAVPTSGAPVSLVAAHGVHIVASFADTTHWTARAKVFLGNGSELLMDESDPLDLDTTYDIKITHDTATGELAMYVDDVESATFTEVHERQNTLPIWQMQLPADSWATNGAAWGVVVAPAAPFSPDDISDLVAWYDAADAATITASSGLVSQWSDKSGNGNHLVQANASFKPTTGTRTLNSLNAIDFIPSDALGTSGAATFDIDHSIFVVFQPDLLTATQIIIETCLDTNSNEGSFIGIVDPGTLTLLTRYHGSTVSGTADAERNYTGAVAGNTPVMVHTENDGTFAGFVVRVNGANAGSGTTQPGYNDNTGTGAVNDRIIVGIRNSGAFPFDGIICEILLYNKVLNSTERGNVETYLMDKWGL